ncbi:MAG TPA: tetratricopeptide repeat protein [bacterium]|nr:tetratricopeptide repeat protein [bacterium]
MSRTTLFLTALLALSFSPFQREVPENRDGTEKYGAQQYDEAGERFEKGGERIENSPELSYNLGAALMKKGDLDGARKAWEKALAQSPAPELKGRIYDGLGALSANRQQYQEAAEFFKRSLRNHPDRDTAANLEIVRRLLQQQQQQQEEKDKGDQKDKKDEEQEQKQQEQKQDQQEQKQDQQQQQQEQKQDQQQQQQEEKKEEQQQAAQAEKKEKEEKDKKDEKQTLAPFRQRKNLQITPFMLEREGDPQGGQTW